MPPEDQFSQVQLDSQYATAPAPVCSIWRMSPGFDVPKLGWSTKQERTKEQRRFAKTRLTTRGEFESVFEAVKNWGRWGAEDELGTLNLINDTDVRDAAALVRSGRRVSMAAPIDTDAGPDNPRPALFHVTRGHDIPLDSGAMTITQDFLGIDYHGDVFTHVDALSHIGYRGQAYGGRPTGRVYTSAGAESLDITTRATGVVGRGVLLDLPRLRGVKWLEPREEVSADELDAAAAYQQVSLVKGDILVFRTGHYRRRLERGPWDNGPAGEGRAGLALDAIPWMHKHGIAAFLADGDGETIPSRVDGIPLPIHVLQIAAMGMCTGDNLQLEDLAAACEIESRWEFLVVGVPLLFPRASGSPWNPVAIF